MFIWLLLAIFKCRQIAFGYGIIAEIVPLKRENQQQQQQPNKHWTRTKVLSRENINIYLMLSLKICQQQFQMMASQGERQSFTLFHCLF